MFLRTKDYYKQIAKDHFEQILKEARNISGDPEILAITERTAIEDIKSYISGRYRVDDVFEYLKTFDISQNYYYGDRIDLTASDYANGTAYVVGNRVVYQSKVYECILNTTGNLPTNATYWSLLGSEGIYYIPYPANYDDRILYTSGDRVTLDFIVYERLNTSGYKEGILPTDTLYFKVIQIADYTAVTGVNPTDAAWTYGDNRNLSIVQRVIDICLYNLHAIINPRNIPELRASRYDACIKFLEDTVRGKMNINLPPFVAQKGYHMRAGSNTPTTHTY